VDEFAADVEIVLAFLAAAEMVADIEVLAGMRGPRKSL
jgi:hypothetical protein